MRILSVLVFSLVAASSVRAGTVASLSFVGSVPPQETVANGVAVSKLGSFVLYRHGHWTAPTSSAVSNTAAPRADPPGPATAEMVHDPALLLVADCGGRSIPWRSGLSERTILGRAAFWPIVRNAECRHGLPGGLLDALVLQESRYDPAAVSRAGAGGLAQLMPATAADLGVRNRFDPVANIDAGARYLRAMINRYNSVPLALAAYNAGLGAVDRAQGIPANSETRVYVSNVLGFWQQAAALPDNVSWTSGVTSLSFNLPSQE